MKRLFPILIVCGLAPGCGEKMNEDEVLQIGITACQHQPAFISHTGLNPNRAAFSTSEKRTKGLALIQLPDNPADTAGRKVWQHPGWSRYGFMGAITTDDNGNVYTIPVPVINVLDNPLEKQNIIYKVSSATGEMNPLVDLPMNIKPGNTNVFGLMGLFYDCHGKKLYASTVAGSSKLKRDGSASVSARLASVST